MYTKSSNVAEKKCQMLLRMTEPQMKLIIRSSVQPD